MISKIWDFMINFRQWSEDNMMSNTILTTIIYTSIVSYVSLSNDNSYSEIEDFVDIDNNEASESDIVVINRIKESAIILKGFKEKLTDGNAAKVSQLDSIPPQLGAISYGVFTQNTERNSVTTDKHVIRLGENFLSGDYTSNELKAILAHEVAHITLNHLNKTDSAFRLLNEASHFTFFATSGVLLRLSIQNLFSEQKNLPSMYILWSCSAIIAQIFAIYSQNLELQADKESMKLSNDPQSLISGLKKMELTIKEKYPIGYFINNTIFRSHPSIATRQQALDIDIKDNASVGDINNSL